MDKAFWKSRTFWGALLAAAVPVATASTTADRVNAGVQAVGVVLAAVGVRGAIAKNGQGK